MPNDFIPPEGEFPFPLKHDNSCGRESAFTGWIRDHSSYLTVGNLATQLGSAASFAWGTLSNALILAPAFLLAALLIGRLHFYFIDHPVGWLGRLAICFGILAGIVFFFRGRSTAKNQNKKAIRPIWDYVSMVVGCLILGIGMGLLFLSVPWMVELMRDSLRESGFAWTALAGSVFGFIVSVAGLRKSLPVPNAVAKSVTLAAICTLGVASLYALVVLLENFVVYGNPFTVVWPWMDPDLDEHTVYLILGAAFLACMIASCAWMGTRRNMWSVLVPALLVFGPLAALGILASRESLRPGLLDVHHGIARLTQPLNGLVSKPLADVPMPDDLKAVFDRLRIQKSQLDEFYDLKPIGMEDVDSVEDCLNPWAVNYFGQAQLIADQGCDLLDSDKEDLQIVKLHLSTIDRLALVKIAKARLADNSQSDKLIQHECRNAVVRVLTRRLMLDETFDLEFGRPELLGDDALNDAVKKTRDRLTMHTPNARHEGELAELLGREKELLQDDFLNRKTIASRGTFELFPSEQIGDSVESSGVDVADTTTIKGEIAKHVLTMLDDNRLDTLIAGTKSEIESVEQSQTDARKLAFQVALLGWMNREQARRTLNERDSRELRWIAESVRRERFNYDDPSFTPSSDLQAIVANKDAGERKNLASIATDLLIERALNPSNPFWKKDALHLSFVSVPTMSGLEEPALTAVYGIRVAEEMSSAQLLDIAMSKFAADLDESDWITVANHVVMLTANGQGGDFDAVESIREDIASNTFPIKLRMLLVLASALACLCFCICDINSSSMHGFYRNQLARAFFLKNKEGFVVPDVDVRLSDLCQGNSKAPYPLINTALNLQASRDLSIRDEKSDYFVFSKLYCGGDRTKYVSTPRLENASGRLLLSTAMAISAAAASPNMGRNTNGFLVLLMTLFNIRLGYWMPNPKSVDPNQIEFTNVFSDELHQRIRRRWCIQYSDPAVRAFNCVPEEPTTDLELVGLAFSGGGIRSAALNLGIAQALEEAKVFGHVDYLSTVSGGGYTGSSIATLMRMADASRPAMAMASDGSLDSSLPTNEMLKSWMDDDARDEQRPSWLKKKLSRWRLPMWNFAKEMVSCLHEGGDWVNLSDGGHIENLATIELLRRRCKFIIIGDGEEDPAHTFNGVGTLIRLAKLDLGIDIELNLENIRLDDNRRSRSHFALGRIHYPVALGEPAQVGYLLYMKSSFSGDENELIKEYRNRKNAFPHESTMDQLFDRGQFEAYRSLGQHVAEEAVQWLKIETRLPSNGDFSDFTVFAAAMRQPWQKTNQQRLPLIDNNC